MIILAEIGDWVTHKEDKVSAHVEDIAFVNAEEGSVTSLVHLATKGQMVYIVRGGTEMWPVRECEVASTITVKKENE